jgi:hypothetical protein
MPAAMPAQPDPTTAMLLGKLIERSDARAAQLDAIGATMTHHGEQLHRIETRLVQGDARMTATEARLDQVATIASEAATAAKTAAEVAAKAAATPPPPAAEMWIKLALQYGLPLFALWATGSIDAAKALLAFLQVK